MKTHITISTLYDGVYVVPIYRIILGWDKNSIILE